MVVMFGQKSIVSCGQPAPTLVCTTGYYKLGAGPDCELSISQVFTSVWYTKEVKKQSQVDI